MLETKANPDAVDVSRLMAGAAKTMRSARNCWLATASEAGGPNFRPMGRLVHDPGDEWKIRFLTDGRSQKAADMRRDSDVTILFQHDPDLAFVTLIGRATLHERAAETRSRWKAAYDVYFPSEQTGQMRFSSRSTPSAWSSGSAASRRSRSACGRQCLSARRGLALDRLDFAMKGGPATPAPCLRRARPASHAGCASRRAPIDARARRVLRA